MTMQDLFEEHAGRSFAKQRAFADWIGKHRWKLDLDNGTVDFGKNGLLGKPRVFEVEVIGTESEGDGAFLWAWANTQSGLPARVLHSVEFMRKWGEEKGVAELTQRKFAVDQWSGHQAAMIAAGMTDAPAYYRGPYEAGAVYFLVIGAPAVGPVPVERIVTVLSQVISSWELNPRNMVTAFLKQEGFGTELEGLTMRAKHKDGRALAVEFDEVGRIGKMSATIGK